MTDKPLRMGDLTARFGVKRWTIHRWQRDLGFPAGRPVEGRKGLVWSEAEVSEWDARSLLSLDRADPV